MRIEANKHPAAAHITDVLLNGVPIQRGTCAWVDLERGEACIQCTDVNGQPRAENGAWVERIIHGAISVRIPDEYRELLTWGAGQ